jgi:SAM-dependent methyltransferase
LFKRLRKLFREDLERRKRSEALHTLRFNERAMERGVTRYRFAASRARGKLVLDVACGRGYGTALLLQSGARRVIGVDISEQELDIARRNVTSNGIDFIQADASGLPFKDGSFQIIVSFETLEHLSGSDEFLAEVVRNLSPSGVFILSTPNRRVFSPFFRSSYSPFHKKEYTLGELAALLNRFFESVDFFGQEVVFRWDLLHYGQRIYHHFFPRRMREGVSRFIPGAKGFRSPFSRRRTEIMPISEVHRGEPMYFVAMATRPRRY